ncbi:bifunctional protein GlmU-like [Liolophura sinensis]|uniref:bifunctional protein GlmU-like n=1 Tax=Liolophura sinensis TaxID=3198878 RepID=UPI00315832CC
MAHAPVSSSLVCYPLRLGPGEEIKGTLIKFVEDNKLKAAFLLSAVGSVTKATLRMADSSTISTFQGPFEIVSLVGTLSHGGHLHVALSDAEGKMLGGHVIGDMEVYTTAEVVIGECSEAVFRREPDSQTGYDELVVTRKTN